MSHKHSHSHHYSPRKTGLWGVLLLTVSYMIAEIIGGIYSGSLALLADAGHMAIDAAAVGLSLFAAWMANKPANSEKTYGYYRAEILAALLNGATLVAVSIWIFYEAWSRFSTPQLVQGELMTGVAVGGLLVNFLGLYLLRGQEEHSLNARGVWLHLLTDTLGSLAAIIAGFLVWKLGWVKADPIISFVIAIFILYGSWSLLMECVDVLLEAVPKGLSIEEIKTEMEEMPEVSEVHDLHVWTVTSGVPSLSCHVKVKENADATKVLKSLTHILEHKFHIDHVTIQIEPVSFEHTGEHCRLGHS